MVWNSIRALYLGWPIMSKNALNQCRICEIKSEKLIDILSVHSEPTLAEKYVKCANVTVYKL